MKEAPVHGNKAIIANNEPSVVADPCKKSFDYPTLFVSAEFSSVLGFGLFSAFSVGADEFYPLPFQLSAERVAVISLIRYQAFGTAFGSAGAIPRDLDFRECLVNKGYFRRGCRGNGVSHRNTLAVDHHHPLCAFPPLGFADACAPFFAGAKLPSMKASSQSKSLDWSSSERNLRHTFSQTSSSSHNFKRRQHVEGLGNRSGKSRHLAPVFNTQRMPSKTSRFSVEGRPTLPGFCLGNNGSIFFHCSSLRNRVCFAIGSPPTAYYPKSSKKSSFITSGNHNILCQSMTKLLYG
jgi:hypothetical protein